MTKIVINNSTVIINNNSVDFVKDARDTLLNKLYYVRKYRKATFGGYENDEKLIDMYFSGKYPDMKTLIRSCKGRGGKTRNECIRCLDIIINSERS